jgi:hypothetical protein
MFMVVFWLWLVLLKGMSKVSDMGICLVSRLRVLAWGHDAPWDARLHQHQPQCHSMRSLAIALPCLLPAPAFHPLAFQLQAHNPAWIGLIAFNNQFHPLFFYRHDFLPHLSFTF